MADSQIWQIFSLYIYKYKRKENHGIIADFTSWGKFLSIVNEYLMGIGLVSCIVKYCNRYLLVDCISNCKDKWNSS